ncbi:unnamed protein product [Soboliphyme baturini]|uniref:Acetyl-coenzyme A transporter 1 n=1 Tax=Soboliphyme baturini TaxID=241478 RepID=A0A183JAT7_9BILA|nr:unnamed protein product [Soboliphyme baturini]
MKIVTDDQAKRSEKGEEYVLCNGMLSYDLNMQGSDVNRSVYQAKPISTTGSKLEGDYLNIILLVFLYILQGVPLGLTASIPLILQNRHVSYKQQAAFSFAYWPFSLKLLWAPLVDAWYSKRFGRRRTWLIPTQYLIGLFLLLLSHYVTGILGDDNDPKPNVFILTAFFFMLNFLASTQDIAVDGWALTMLSKRNVGHASTCNSIGQTAGYFLGNVVFLALESTEFCNNYLRFTPSDRGIVTMSEYVYFWAIVFVVSTTMVMLLKKEGESSGEIGGGGNHDTGDLNVLNTYKWLWRVIRLKPVLILMFVHLTAKVSSCLGIYLPFKCADQCLGVISYSSRGLVPRMECQTITYQIGRRK